jgi:hypothetical protein
MVLSDHAVWPLAGSFKPHLDWISMGLSRFIERKDAAAADLMMQQLARLKGSCPAKKVVSTRFIIRYYAVACGHARQSCK